MLLTPARTASLTAAALAAPSADNRHVVRPVFDGDRVRLFDAADLDSAIQNRRVLGLLSAGAVTENLLLRAATLGLSLAVTRHSPGRVDGLLVELVAREQAAVADPRSDVIASRHTDRRLAYGRGALGDHERKAMAAEATGADVSALSWLDDTPARRSLALQLVRRAESERFRQPDLHRELFESIRFDAGWHGAPAHGIPPGALALPIVERPAFLALRHWRVQQAANLFGGAGLIGFRAGDLPCRLAPGLGAITATGDIGSAAFDAGRLLQRVWLRATVLGLAMQVFAASPLYALDGSEFIAPALRRRLADGWRSLCPGTTPYVVFRLGRSGAAGIRAGRPDHFPAADAEPDANAE